MKIGFAGQNRDNRSLKKGRMILKKRTAHRYRGKQLCCAGINGKGEVLALSCHPARFYPFEARSVGKAVFIFADGFGSKRFF
jgi:hypothetical protein